jgi:hypothetical protein
MGLTTLVEPVVILKFPTLVERRILLLSIPTKTLDLMDARVNQMLHGEYHWLSRFCQLSFSALVSHSIHNFQIPQCGPLRHDLGTTRSKPNGVIRGNANILLGMVFFPDSPRWLLMQERDEEAFSALSKLRRLPADYPDLVAEALDIKASIILENHYVKENYAGKSGFALHAAQVKSKDIHLQIQS